MMPRLQDTDGQAFFKVLAIKNLYMMLSLDTFCVKAQCTFQAHTDAISVGAETR